MSNPTEIFFRADGNPRIGSGHIMRCLSLAGALRDRGARCVFLLADDRMLPAVTGRGFAARVLGTHWQDMAAELPALLPLLHPDALVVVDRYALVPAWLDAVQRLCPVARAAHQQRHKPGPPYRRACRSGTR